MNTYQKDVNELLIEVKKDFAEGNYTIYGLYKKYNVPIKAIKNYFNKNNINWSAVNNSKVIIQCDLKGKPIKEWGSGNKIKKELSYNASAISEVCRGIRKSYKKYIWKFKN